MAYVLGFLYADGSIVDARKSSRTQYIKLVSKDEDILRVIKNTLNAEHPIHYKAEREILYRNGKVYKSSGLFYLRIGSRRMFSDVKKLGLIPNKSKVIKFPNFIPKKYLSCFIGGYFDGDGCVYLERTNRGIMHKNLKRLSIIFTSGSKNFLIELSNNIKFLGIKHKKAYSNNGAYQLRYSTSESIILFKFIYKNLNQDLYLKRKFKTFLNYFKEKPLKIDSGVLKIINKELRRGAREDRERSAKPFYVGANPAHAS